MRPVLPIVDGEVVLTAARPWRHLSIAEGRWGGQVAGGDQEGATPLADGLSYARAKAFRRQLTPPELTLWRCVRAKRFLGYKFRRQHPVGPYILDFYCAAAKLAVEIDGQSHDHPERIEHDRRRTGWLGRRGIRVMRIAAVDVRDELDGVMEFILMVLRQRCEALGPVSPPPGR